ncbi:IDEAL domain-containing protein [Staphylococcus agnetis]|uniref:IDEAL domain-containing protein n=1 Tax=Staphylococcus agnetis TaxID=985762 RepID=UPI00208F17D4|nr:IDEAL domain-containing protein [Staphylococcus agnetis]MCO4345201.1 IDEAL domain-containing protein [Staphylococcus agnetis]MCO4354834.1 IDEAL domain-containing protein [Staphylococcus agnetis]MCO4359595.1 IDEAL domain-containing protein [Staphylococcus agnetis]MCO4365191.1 IDEAL domain-containing protein [Staphylococcus agnetis]MCO4371350.1 IDEAL domain-containing protein [Staphylococcus agnetis]
MKHQLDTKTYNNTNAMHMIHQLSVELVIEDALKNQRKQQLKHLIDEALQNKNEANFNKYTAEYLKLEELEVEIIS